MNIVSGKEFGGGLNSVGYYMFKTIWIICDSYPIIWNKMNQRIFYFKHFVGFFYLIKMKAH